MSEKQVVTVRLTQEMTREVSWEIDLDEYLEWSGGEQPTAKKVKEFLEGDREYDSLADSMWAQGREVRSSAYPFPDIEEVRL